MVAACLLSIMVSFAVIDGGTADVGLITIPGFQAETFEETAAALDELDALGITDIIIDLRGNSGGLLNAATETAGLFIPSGPVFTLLRDDSPDSPEEHRTRGTNAERRIAVLVNAFTASSAEVFAAAVQESGAGVVIGVRTRGKTIVRYIFQAYEGAAVEERTIGRYLTRDGTDITNVGIMPNFSVRNEYAFTEEGSVLVDRQMEAALEFLASGIVDEKSCVLMCFCGIKSWAVRLNAD